SLWAGLQAKWQAEKTAYHKSEDMFEALRFSRPWGTRRNQIGGRDMSDDNKNEKVESGDPARREALIKIGKYAAYTAPAMMVTVGTAKAGTDGPAPSSGPSPT
ncbi:MAG: hypothetical protein O7B81_14640, partial [Gammaproteobacteria bacterium]|nr:hypothetical protein [Gammaproteobacteria bacterium]